VTQEKHEKSAAINKISTLLKSGVSVVNFGMENFYTDLKEQGISVVQLDWRPPVAKKDLLSKLKKLKQG
jgi:hypothetical protein